MRIFLPLIVSLLLTVVVAGQQYSITMPDTWSGGTHSDPLSGYTETSVFAEIIRLDGARYDHYSPIFNVQSIGGWLTQFNNGDLPNPFGEPGTNVDYFLLQGESYITGDNSVITFDEIYFDIGAGNTMHITNSTPGYDPAHPENFRGQAPGGVTVANALHFNNGITTTLRSQPVNGAIAFVNSAFYDGGLTDAQHVDGFVSEINYEGSPQSPGHNGDFTFPVGDDASVYQLRRQGVFNENYHTLTVGWVNEDPNDPTTIDPTQGEHNSTGFLPPGISICRAGFWDWQFQDGTVDAETAPNKGALAMANAQTVTVSIPDLVGFPGLLASELRLIGYDPRFSGWIDLSTLSGLPTPYASGLTKGSTLKGIIPEDQLITAIAIGSTNAIILPVTFSSFTVKSEGCKALLKWETSSEQNNSHFKVERSSDGSAFTAIARVGAVGNSNSVNTYKYTDEAPATGTNYYRITQVDFDGKYSSTEIKVVKIQCSGGNVALLRAYPNPATNQVYIQTGKAVARVNILSSNGQTVLKYMPSQTEGGGTFPINIQRLQKGVYLLQVINKDGTANVIKLLKQ